MAPAAMTVAARDALERRGRTGERTAAERAPRAARTGTGRAAARTASSRAASSRAASPRAASARAASPRAASARATVGARPANPRQPVAPGHPRRVSRSTTPSRPRRVSGPLSGAAVGSGGAVVLPRPGIAPRRPAAPARPRRRTGIDVPASALGIAIHAGTLVRTLPDHAWLDRVVRGRAWIVLLGVMLVGIVGMQVEMLKLGAAIGRATEQSASLASRNQTLEASVARLGDDRRIERLAAAQGMVMPQPAGVGFLTPGPNTLRRALANIHPPSSSTFADASHGNGAITTSPSAAGSGSATAGAPTAGVTTGAPSAGATTAATTSGSTAATTTASTGTTTSASTATP